MIHKNIISHITGLPWSGKNNWKMKIFQVREKSGNFVDGQGNLKKALESQEKVREFENKWMWQADLRKFILFKREKDVLSHEIV